MDNRKIQEVLATATDALERSQHFRTSTKVYQEFLARKAKEKAIQEKEEENRHKKKETIESIHQTRLRKALAQHAILIPPPQPKPKKKIKKKQSMTTSQKRENNPDAVGLTKGKLPLHHHHGNSKSECKMKEINSSHALAYTNLSTPSFTVRNNHRHEIMMNNGEKSSRSNLYQNYEHVSQTYDLQMKHGSSDLSSLRRQSYHQHKDPFINVATLGLHSKDNMSLDSNISLENWGTSKHTIKPPSLLPTNYTLFPNTMVEPISLHEDDDSSTISIPTPPPPNNMKILTDTVPTTLPSKIWKRLIPSKSKVIEESLISNVNIPQEEPEEEETPISPELNATLNTIIENLKILCEDTNPMNNNNNNKFIKKDENFEYLSKIRLQHEKPKMSQRSSFPPGIQPKTPPRETSYYGYPYFTKSGAIVDTHGSYHNKLYPSPGFNYEFNMTQVHDKGNEKKKEKSKKLKQPSPSSLPDN